MTRKRKFDPTKEELERLVWEQPTTAVAAMFGVSEMAVRKRCRLLGIAKPPPGYWAKKKAGKPECLCLPISQQVGNHFRLTNLAGK